MCGTPRGEQKGGDLGRGREAAEKADGEVVDDAGFGCFVLEDLRR